jgi:hypothetical protein
MEILKNSHRLIAQIRAQCGILHGIDSNHRCDVEACKYRQLRGTHTFVCVASLHVHTCSMACTLAEANTAGIKTCPISGIQVAAELHAHYPTRETVRGVQRFVDTCVFRKGSHGRHTRRVHVNRNNSTRAVRACLDDIAAHTSSYQSRVKKIATAWRPAWSFQASMRQLMAAFADEDTSKCVPPTYVCTSIAAYVDRVRPHIRPTPSIPTLVAVVYSLLAVGMTSNNVQVFPRVPWVAEHAPELTLYANVPGIQCRAMSAATRALKRSMAKRHAICELFVFELAAGVGDGQHTDPNAPDARLR